MFSDYAAAQFRRFLIVWPLFHHQIFPVTTMGLGSPIDFDEGWDDIEWAIFKLVRILEGLLEPPFDAEDYMVIYSTIYNMCIQKAPHDHSEQLYEAYRESVEAYNAEIVLPSFTDKHGELLLLELVSRWRNHQVLMRWLWHFFIVLDQYYVYKAEVPGLKQVGLVGFREQVFQKVKDNARAAVMGLIHEERQGGLIDRALLKDVIDIFVGIGNGEMSVYEADFEEHMMRGSCEYYSRIASDWIVEASCPDYMFKAEECLRREKERISHYLHSSSEQKLLEKVHYELVVVYAHQLLDKRDSGCSALLRDNKEEDLARMYRLYNRTPKSLELVVNAFKKHVIDEGKAFVQQAEDAASNQQASNAEHGVVLITKIIEMYDKYVGYVNDCFMKDSLFQKAMREAFEVFCNIPVSGSPSAELLAGFCDSILKKGGCQYSDEAIDETFEKVVKVLAYFNDKDVFLEFCRKKLARRLLFDRSANDDHEKSFLTKLKQNCGGQFTAKMEGMVCLLVSCWLSLCILCSC